jgi:phosphatidylserine/phosphatidylglycerophosphate/cardiolipin synthase-like enzyme
MPQHAQDQARIVSVRLPADVLQRLDRVLDWQATARQRPASRNAAMREALCAWLDDHEQRAGLVEPHRLWQQFQTVYQSLASHHDSVPIHQLCQWLSWPRERFDTVLEALRAAQHVDLETGTARELSPQALADSYQVHGQLCVRVRWRA